MKKILFTAHAVTIAHVIRPLLVAKELKKRGHQVSLGFSHLDYSYLPEKENIPFFKLTSLGREKEIAAVRNLRYDIKATTEQFSQDLDSDLQLLDKIKPDLVVNDTRLTIKLACIIRKIPYLSLLNAYHSGKLAVNRTIPEVVFLSQIIPRRIQKILFRITFSAMNNYLGIAIREVAKKRGVLGINNAIGAFTSDKLNLITDIPEFFPCKNLTPIFHYVGPFLWEPDIPLPEWFAQLDESRPIIYFTLGTSGTIQHMKEILQELSDQDYQIILSTGGIKYEAKLPEGVYVADFLPALKLLDKVAVVICHGGNGTIYQALSKAVPVIGLPTFYDQEWNSERLEDLKIGKRLTLSTFTKARLIKCLEELINSQEVKNNCLKFKELISRYDAPKISADLVEAR